MDGSHMVAFSNDMPWWVRPMQNETDLTVPDFVNDVRGRLERSIGRADKGMGQIFKSRRVFAQAFSYKAARNSANLVKSGYGVETFMEHMQHGAGMMHKAKRIGFPKGDPLYGKYGSPSQDRSSGQSIYLQDLTGPERKLASWLKDPSTIEEVFSDSELRRYTAKDPATRCVFYAIDLRKKLWKIIGDESDNNFDASWRDECVGACIDHLIALTEKRQDQHVEDIIGQDGATEALSMNASDAIEKYVRPQTLNRETAIKSLSLLEQMFVIAAENGDLDEIQIILQMWNEITQAQEIAPNSRPSGGVAGLTIKCRAENIPGVIDWLGPNPTAPSSSAAPDA